MTDVGVDTDQFGVATELIANVQSIPLTKVKVDGVHATVEINFDEIPMSVYKEMLFLGAKEYINSVGMSKIGAGLTKLSGASLEKAHNDIKAQAAKNAEAITTGEGFKFHGAKAGASADGSKVTREVNTEAMRLAKALVKYW